MNRRERLKRCYFHQETDRPAVYSRAGFPHEDPTYDRLRAYLNALTELKGSWAGNQFEAAPPTDTRTEPHSEDFDRQVVTLHTPTGTLRRSQLVSRKGQPGMHETYLINTPEDAERFLSIPIPPIQGDPSSFFAQAEAMGDRGIVEAGLGMNPAGFVVELCGSETFAILSVTHRDVLHRLCARQRDLMLQRLRFLLQAGIGPFFGMLGEEYVVPPLHGPVDFRDFNVRYDKPIIDLIHEAGGRIHIHSHGSMSQVIRDFVEMGTDVLHPFEPPPQGDILAREAKSAARGRMCLEGNIQIHRMYEATPDEIRRETEALIRDAFDDGRGLIVSPTASPYIRGQGEACYPQYKAMIDAVLDSGGR